MILISVWYVYISNVCRKETLVKTFFFFTFFQFHSDPSDSKYILWITPQLINLCYYFLKPCLKFTHIWRKELHLIFGEINPSLTCAWHLSLGMAAWEQLWRASSCCEDFSFPAWCLVSISMTDTSMRGTVSVYILKLLSLFWLILLWLKISKMLP